MSSGESHSPLDQFKIYDLIPIGPSSCAEGTSCYHTMLGFTNASLFMILSVVLVSAFLIGGMKKKSLVPDRWQSAVELFYEFVANMLKENVGVQGRTYFPFIFSLFMFVLGCNLLGLFPYYNFTVTSHIIVTFTVAIIVFISVTVIGFSKHGTGYFRMFLPHGVPVFIAPMMIAIELMSYLVRPVTLSLRLAGNMMAGHILLKVLAGFVVSLGVLGVVPFAFLIIFIAFEFLVALLQAYIFSLLICIYLNDALNMH